MKILATDVDDIAAVIALLQTSGLPVDDIEGPLLENFLKAVDENGFAGVAGLEPLGNRDVLLRSLAVRDDYRGLGIGRRLTRELEQRARALGMERVFLLTDTAEHFFAALGYQRIARETVPDSVAHTAQFTSLCPASAACMCKALTRTSHRDSEFWIGLAK